MLSMDAGWISIEKKNHQNNIYLVKKMKEKKTEYKKRKENPIHKFAGTME